MLGRRWGALRSLCRRVGMSSANQDRHGPTQFSQNSGPGTGTVWGQQKGGLWAALGIAIKYYLSSESSTVRVHNEAGDSQGVLLNTCSGSCRFCMNLFVPWVLQYNEVVPFQTDHYGHGRTQALSSRSTLPISFGHLTFTSVGCVSLVFPYYTVGSFHGLRRFGRGILLDPLIASIEVL